ncbi:hypothetical protein J5N97_020186 [Dioscorea zingiberensis]|uniref:Polygalacturonase n=1 Tax=Dioscorea zingiberensis TaxID=325984 RepID=A0A9D5HDF2_9LILI|nr:hypothetical protein J5N97_020186 [Dioscorea zingiberensis]
MNSELYHIVINGCEGVQVQGVKISAPGNSPNTDGIHVQMSTDVTITAPHQDYMIVSRPPYGTTNLWIERVTCGPGHGIRIKTWGKPSDGFVKGVVFEHALMQNVQNPIIIDQNYCPNNRGCPNHSSGVKISGVTYNDIRGSSATQVAVNFDCSPSNPWN